MKKEIVFLIKVMNGGGAERVISLLSGAVAERDFNVSLIITHQSLKDSVLSEINNRVKVISLPDEVGINNLSSPKSDFIMYKARLVGKLPGFKYKSSVLKYYSRNYNSVSWLRDYFKKYSGCTVVAFLYDSIFLSLLSVNKTNKLIISERGDPCQSNGSKTTEAFMKSEFQKADAFVFQSPDVKKWYNENTCVKGRVIFNPVKADLPEPYFGQRKKAIVNFCRISSEKNLILLVDAFEKFHRDFPEYELHIFGDSVESNAEGYVEKVKERIKEKKLDGSVSIFPSRKDIHSVIRDYGMFVSSSDFEGMSNSMLEAMALGLPSVCTDCPAGGARAVIKDGENGLLVPVNDSEALYRGMKRVIENPELAEKLSHNAVKIREDLSVEKIIDKWMEIING